MSFSFQKHIGGCCFARSFLRSPQDWVQQAVVHWGLGTLNFPSQTNCGTKPAGQSTMDNFVSIPTRIGTTEYDTTCDIICPYLMRYDTIPTLHMIQHVIVWHYFTVLETSTLLNGICESMTCIQSYQFSTHEPSFRLQVHWLKTRWWFQILFMFNPIPMEIFQLFNHQTRKIP